jgi:hypothetical protein
MGNFGNLFNINQTNINNISIFDNNTNFINKYFVYICMSLNLTDLYIGCRNVEGYIIHISVKIFNGGSYLHVFKIKNSNDIENFYVKIDLNDDDIQNINNINNIIINDNNINTDSRFNIVIVEDVYYTYKTIKINNMTNEIYFDEHTVLLFEKDEIYDPITYYEMINMVETLNCINKNFIHY